MIPLRAAAPEADRPQGSPPLIVLLRNWQAERLLVLGSGPLPVDDAKGGVVALDGSGRTILAVEVQTVTSRAAAQIADELDRLAQIGPGNLGLVESQPAPEETIEERFTDVFGAQEVKLNREQGAILVVAAEPSPQVWQRLNAEVGPRLRGVFQREGEELIKLPPPPAAPARAKGSLPMQTRIAAAAVALGVLLAVIALIRVLNPAPAAQGTAGLFPKIHTVAARVPGSATHTQWIGQQHLVHTSDGRLLALFSGPTGLEIVADGANNGATWKAPFAITSIRPASFAAAIDAEGRLHVAFSDAHGVSYTVLRPSPGGWRASAPVRLDPNTKTPLMDVAWDSGRRTAHVVWVKDTPHGQEPYWAGITSTRGKTVVRSLPVAAPGRAVPVLLNEAVDPSSGRLLVTYRSGTSIKGWMSRTATPLRSGEWRWAPPERVRTRAFIGAAALAVDRQGTAHLVLRDSTDYRLLYYTHPAGGGWSQGEVAVQAHATSQVDFPALALDDSSKLVYLFYETDQFETAPEIRVAIRDPASGWSAPTPLASLPQGDYYPTTLRNFNGQAIALWTRGSGVPSIEAARVSAP